MSGKARGNFNIGGDKKTRDKMRKNNPRGRKKGGRKSFIRGKNTKVKIKERTERRNNPSRFKRR